jgi:hypothetical protein
VTGAISNATAKSLILWDEFGKGCVFDFKRWSCVTSWCLGFGGAFCKDLYLNRSTLHATALTEYLTKS